MGLRSVHAGLGFDEERRGSSARDMPDSSYLGLAGSQETNLRRLRQRLVGMRLFAYREDLAEWFARIFEEPSITEKTFISSIDDGILLCRLATLIDARHAEGKESTRGFAVGHTNKEGKHKKLRYNSRAKKKSFFCPRQRPYVHCMGAQPRYE